MHGVVYISKNSILIKFYDNYGTISLKEWDLKSFHVLNMEFLQQDDREYFFN